MKEVKEISLLDMCFYILSKWKIMIIAVLVCGILAGAVSYLDSYNQYKESQVITEEEPVKEISLTEEEIKALDAKIAVIQEYEENIAEYDYYMENSIKMKLNPNRFYRGTLTYYFEAENSENVTKAKLFCESELLKESNYEELSVMLTETTDAAFIREILFIDDKFEFEGETSGEFSVCVEHYNRDDCKIMFDYFEDQMIKMEEALKEKGIAVDVQKLSSDISTCSDYSLVQLSNDVKVKRLGAYESIRTIEEQLTEEQKEYYTIDEKKDEAISEDAALNDDIQKPNVKFKYIVVGAVVGVFLILGFYSVIYLFDKRIHTKEELESLVSMPVYKYKVQGKEKIGYIDSVLNSVKSMLAEEKLDTPEMIAQMIVNTVQKANAHKICITGTAGNFDSDAFKCMKTLLVDRGLDVMISENGLNDAQSLQQAVDCGYIVFLERCNVSKESDIRAEITTTSTCGIEVLGVILEG